MKDSDDSHSYWKISHELTQDETEDPELLCLRFATDHVNHLLSIRA